MSPRTTPLVSRYTYRLHARAAVLEGILAGILVTHDVVARKSLGADQFQLVLLTMAPGSSWLLSLFLAERVQEVERRKLFLWTGILGRLPLLLVAAIHGPWPFLGILVIHGFVQTALIPAQNALYQANYDPHSRGRLFGRASVWGGVATAATALGAGLLMDHDPAAYRWLYGIAGVAGLLACIAYGSIRLRRTGGRGPAPPPPPVAATVPREGGWRAPGFWRRARGLVRETLVEDAGFRRFEVGLFVYGLGFMCMQPVFARLFVDELRMDYAEASLAKGVVFYAVNIAAVALAGRMHDRVGLERLAARSCAVLMVFASALAWVATPLQAIAAFAVFGVGMAGINIVWSMGPIRYAPPGAAARYMAVHVALVGLRALLGHPLGGWIAERAGETTPTFVVAALLFALATVLLVRAERLAGVPPGIRPATAESR